jgi:AbrB family looped-hinge helix DNA binding protein
MIFSRGRIVLPAPLREQDGIRPGDEFTVERIDRGEYRLVRQQPIPNDGVVEWLLSFFVPIDSESADSISSTSTS